MATPPAYSIRLFAGENLAPGSTNSFNVPAGFKFVIRCMDAYPRAFINNQWLIVNGNLQQVIWFVQFTTGGATHFQWKGRQVLLPNEPYAIVTSGGAWDCTISGYQLTSP